MGLFDNIIGTATEDVEPLGMEMITDDNKESSGSGSNSGPGSASNSSSGTWDGASLIVTTPATDTTSKESEIPDIDIGGSMEFFSLPETTEIATTASPISETPEASRISITESVITEETIPEINIPDTVILSSEWADSDSNAEAISSVETTPFSLVDTPIAITEDIKSSNDNEDISALSPIEILDLSQNTSTEEGSKNHESLAERISAFLKELQDLKSNDEAAKVKLEEELKQIQSDEKKIDETITLLNKIKNV